MTPQLSDPGVRRAYAGPHLVPTVTEIALILDAMTLRHDPAAVALRAKCERALSTDPRFRRPTT